MVIMKKRWIYLTVSIITLSLFKCTDKGIMRWTKVIGWKNEDVEFIKRNENGYNQWSKTFGGESNDEGFSVQQTSDGGYIIAGYTQSYGQDGAEIYLIKTDKNGDKEWEKIFGGGFGFSVQQTRDGGYIITGGRYSHDGIESGLFLIKTDKEGNEEWERTFKEGYGKSVQQTSDEGYIITGAKFSYTGGGCNPIDYHDLWLIKTDKNGHKEWERRFGKNNDDVGYSVQQTSDGGYIITGYTESYGRSGYDVWVIKTDKDGNKEWERTFGGKEEDVGASVQQSRDGGYIIAGWTSSYERDGYDVYLIKTDRNGNEEWERVFRRSRDDRAYSVQQTSDGGYIITGETESHSRGKSDVCLIKTDKKGYKEWEKRFGGDGSDVGYSVQQTSDGGYIIGGYTESYGAGWRDVWLIKTDISGNVEEE